VNHRTPATGLFPALLRHWRGRRGLSQLDLATAADVSPRHLSFLETGRANPGREMVLRLGATLDVPMRDQNELLRAAGFEPAFGDGPAPDALPPLLEGVLQRMMAAHDPLPLVVLNRRYDVLRASDGAQWLLSRFVADPSALGASLNVFTVLFDPRLARPFVVDWPRVAHALVARLHRECLARGADEALHDLLRAVLAAPGVPAAWRQPDFSAPSEPVLALRLRRDDLALSLVTTVTSFSAPGNAAAEELRIESYYPLDDATAAAFAQRP